MPADLNPQALPTAAAVTGETLTAAARAGELVPRDWVSPGPVVASGRSLTIPVSPEHAVGGHLRIGDRIDVFATFNAGDVRARTTAAARAVEVVGSVEAGGLITGEEATVGITVAVTPEEAARLAFAIRTGEIDIARVEAPAPPGRLLSIDARSFQ